MDNAISEDKDYLRSRGSNSMSSILPLSSALVCIFALCVLPMGFALPIVDKGVFVITGVKTCGENGTGYCVLGPDCSVDKEFEPMDDSEEEDDPLNVSPAINSLQDLIDSQREKDLAPKTFLRLPKNHCDGLKKAFTPSAAFSCCQYVNNSVQNTLPTLSAQPKPKPQLDEDLSGLLDVTKNPHPISSTTQELTTPPHTDENIPNEDNSSDSELPPMVQEEVKTTNSSVNAIISQLTANVPEVPASPESEESPESVESNSVSIESAEDDEKEEDDEKDELEDIHKPGHLGSDPLKTSEIKIQDVDQPESTTIIGGIEERTEINLLQESISVVHLNQPGGAAPIPATPITSTEKSPKEPKNPLREEIHALIDKCNSNSEYSEFSPRKDRQSGLFGGAHLTNRRILPSKGRVAIPNYANSQNLFKNPEECHYTVAIVRRPTLLTSFSSYSYQDPGSFICAGSLISSRVIVTSATCVSRLIFINNSYFKQNFKNNGRNSTGSEDELNFNKYLQMFRVVIGTKHILHPSRLYRILLSNPNSFENTTNEINMREIERIKIHENYKILNANGHFPLSNGEQSHNLRVNDIALLVLKAPAYEGVKNITEHQRRLKTLNRRYNRHEEEEEEPQEQIVDDELEESDEIEDNYPKKPQQKQKQPLNNFKENNMDIKVCPICLPFYNYQNSGEHTDENNYNQCVVTGYSHPTSESSSESDGVFHEASQVIHNNDQNCLFYSSTFYDEAAQVNDNLNNHTDSNLNIKSTMLCASSGNEPEACFSPRDAGSPLACSNRKSDNKFLLGVFSSGFHCAAPESPVLYTDVRSYVNWILENV